MADSPANWLLLDSALPRPVRHLSFKASKNPVGAAGHGRCMLPPVPWPRSLEYKAACRDPAQRIVSGLSEPEVETIVTALCAVAVPVATRFPWRPQLHDPADEMVLDTAINSVADTLMTFNRKDFGQTPGRFGIALLPHPACSENRERRCAGECQ